LLKDSCNTCCAPTRPDGSGHAPRPPRSGSYQFVGVLLLLRLHRRFFPISRST
jgi:hypothetical protein